MSTKLKYGNFVKETTHQIMSTFTGFSEEDLIRIKSGETTSDGQIVNKKPKFIHPTSRKKVYQYKSVELQNQKIDDAIDNLQFDKCRLSIRPTLDNNDENVNKNVVAVKNTENTMKTESNGEIKHVITIDYEKEDEVHNKTENGSYIKHSSNNVENTSMDVHDNKRVADYAEDDLALHRVNLEELQLQQKLMEEQNKKRKEMLDKALADRTRQTEEEVMKLDKIKKELQVLDDQFTQGIGVLRKKIDLACLAYSETEKHYLKVEKEFLQAKLQLQKEKEKKELLTEHLCALITHNETRKAQKLETLMLELAINKNANSELASKTVEPKMLDEKGDSPVIVDGVDQRTGKMVEFNGNS